MNYGIDQEFEQALAVVQKILEIMLRVQEENRQKAAQASSDQKKADQPVESETTKPEAITPEAVEELDDQMKELNVVKRDIKNSIERPQPEQTEELINDSELSELTDDTEKRMQDLKIELDKLMKQLDVAKKELTAININNPSALQRFGEKLIKLDASIKILNNRINTFFRSLPERFEKSAANFLIGKLDQINDKTQSLKEQLNEKITESEVMQENTVKVNEVVNPEKAAEKIAPVEVIKNENENGPGFKTAKEMIANKDDFYRIKDLIVDNIQKDFNSMSTSMESVIAEALERNRLQQAKTEELSGLKTEIDPKTATIESMNANKNVKTVASVKEELEEVTLSDYGDDMEAAYQVGFDTDPNVATEVTDEEWAEQQDYYENCWEPEM